MQKFEMTPASTPFVVMAKPVGSFCNLKCGYCYYLETERFDNDPDRLRMSDDLLETFIRQYISTSPGPIVSFTWHGGEPTLAGLDFYKRAVELQQEYLPEGWSCWNNLQTNGMLLDDAWCSFLAEAHFDVGLSIDGTRLLHDQVRKDHNGKGTYERAVNAVRLLQAHGIQPDLLCTVTSSIAKEPLAVYRALRELNTGWIQFIPIVRRTEDGQILDETVSGEAYGDFLCAVFDEWIQNDLGKSDVQLFAEIAMVLSGGTVSLCWMAPTCGRVLIVEKDGAVYSCDHFVDPEHRIGDIKTASLSTLVDGPEQNLFGNNKHDLLPQKCRSCAWLALCNGGCLKDRFDFTESGEPGLNCLCDGFEKIFAHAVPRLQQVLQLRRSGSSFEDIMVKMRSE